VRRHLPYALVCVAAAAAIGAAAGWQWGLPAGLVLCLIAVGLRIVLHRAGELADELARIEPCGFCSDLTEIGDPGDCVCVVPCMESGWCGALKTTAGRGTDG
jgi:hypothetical protein